MQSLLSGADFLTWKRILEDSEPQMLETGAAKLGQMYRYCTGASCRHRTLLQYFNQNLEKDNCGACDICLAEVEGVPDALVLAQKILSGILRQGERFSADYTAAVLTGSREDRILTNRHDKLSTYGLLKESGRSVVRDWIEQLADQEYIERSGEYGVLRVTEKGRLILKGQAKPLILEPSRKKPARKTHAASDISESVDPDIIEALRKLRTELARQRRVPAYIIFGDATLRDLARKSPCTPEGLLRVSGIGPKKLEQSLRASQCASSVEQDWLPAELEHCFGYSLDELARKFDRSASWVSRRLALVALPPDSVQQQIRSGKIAPHCHTVHIRCDFQSAAKFSEKCCKQPRKE
ncbi:MAG: RQC domain-containing protein [Acidobacteriota bacterium]|nr:RQC domain-containing protein [Acidobacteriota bacterium]